jgi:mRNA-degrading endonuclease toxin of MazEF toxin-antitoxin module
MPAEGDIIGIDSDSGVGHEQHGRRPVLVVSVNALQTSLGLAMVCAITTHGGLLKGRATIWRFQSLLDCP